MIQDGASRFTRSTVFSRSALELLEGQLARTVERAQGAEAERDELRAQRDALLAACRLACEWAAAFPLTVVGIDADREAANEVYSRCSAAIARAEGEAEDERGQR